MKYDQLVIRQLEKLFTVLRQVPHSIKQHSWIKTIRRSLCISSKDLGHKLNISQQAIAALERNELNGTISLNSLKMVAHGLNCSLHYILIPNEPLDLMLNKQSTLKASEIYKLTTHTMLLENQAVSLEETNIQIKELANNLKLNSTKDIWKNIAMQFTYAIGATPYNPDDNYYLIPQHITLQSELDEWEQRNISLARLWAFKHKRNNILTVKFIKLLHKYMFNKTWRWAGLFGTYQTNIGCNAAVISYQLSQLLDNIEYYLNNNTYPITEIAVRLHHGLVLIHPFPNGNGRHARLMTDLLMHNMTGIIFSWGAKTSTKNLRENYIRSLQKADQHQFQELIDFVNS